MSIQNKNKLLQLFNEINFFKDKSAAGNLLITLKSGKSVIGKSSDIMFDRKTGVGYIIVADEKIFLRDIKTIQ